ncbi:MAG TPA: hypothetical protein VHH12_05290, partial [Mycobacterium sp.]|nr:hypothetical protein [Mycobacterium sp.]
TIVAVTVLWATRIYSDRPSAGLATATAAQGIGLLFGPLTAGILADTTSLTTALLAGALIVCAAAPFAPRPDIVNARSSKADRPPRGSRSRLPR